MRNKPAAQNPKLSRTSTRLNELRITNYELRIIRSLSAGNSCLPAQETSLLGGFGFDELEGHAIAFPNGEKALPILLTFAQGRR